VVWWGLAARLLWNVKIYGLSGWNKFVC